MLNRSLSCPPGTTRRSGSGRFSGASLGLDAVALAASYHATRAGTPLHPVHRIFEAETAACYVPIRESAWRGQRLVPVAPDWDPGGDSFGNAFRQLTDQGLPVEAWIVLAHNSALGREHCDLVVRTRSATATRTRLPVSRVQEYCLTLVQESSRVRPTTCGSRSCGPWGSNHAGIHEKTEFALWAM